MLSSARASAFSTCVHLPVGICHTSAWLGDGEQQACAPSPPSLGSADVGGLAGRYVATGGAEEDARCAAMGLQALQAGEGRDGIEESQLRIAPW